MEFEKGERLGGEVGGEQTLWMSGERRHLVGVLMGVEKLVLVGSLDIKREH